MNRRDLIGLFLLAGCGLSTAQTDPGKDVIGMVTVTRVVISNDLSWANVSVSVMGEEADKARALEGLRSAAGFLRSKLGKTLHTRIVPEVKFELDRGLEHAARINEVLAELKREEQA